MKLLMNKVETEIKTLTCQSVIYFDVCPMNS